jgi:hypothetical protein
MRSALCRALGAVRGRCPLPASCCRCATTSATGKAPPSACCATSACRCWCPTTITRRRRVGRPDPAQGASGLFPRPPQCARELPDLHRDSLVRKLAIKPDSPYYDWLERELAHRFDVACCATQEQFRRERGRSPAPARSRRPASGTRRTTATPRRPQPLCARLEQRRQDRRARSQGRTLEARSASWAAASAGSSTEQNALKAA